MCVFRVYVRCVRVCVCVCVRVVCIDACVESMHVVRKLENEVKCNREMSDYTKIMIDELHAHSINQVNK